MLGEVPVRAVPLINRCSACRALQEGRHVACRARDVVVRDNGRTHRLERPIGGVAPVRWSGGGASTEKCGGGEQETNKCKLKKRGNDMRHTGGGSGVVVEVHEGKQAEQEPTIKTLNFT